jgi:DNA-binding NarL/FixJ family response regulator
LADRRERLMYYGYRTRRGESAPNSKLDSSDREEIKRRRSQGDTYAEIAQDLGVCINTVRKVAQGISYQEDPWG